MMHSAYCIHGTFGRDFNLAVWLQLPNLIYANTTYNHMYYEYCTLSIALFTKLNICQCTLHPNSPNLLSAKYTA